MKVIDQINGSALFAQSAFSASISTKDSLGRDITATYLTGINLPESATWNDTTNVVQSNSSTWNDVTAYQSNSANYITAHQSLEGLMSASLLESADGKWTAYNSIPFKAGDEFPASADEAIITYQTNSGLYLTAHQDISNKLDTTAFSDVSGDFLTTSFGISESATWNDTTNVVQTNSATWGQGGGTTYTSPSGTILINDDTLEATTSAIGTTVKTVEVDSSNSYFSAIPGYPFDTYSAQSTDMMKYLTLRYGDWSDGFTVNDAMTANTIEIPLTSGGYDLWLYNGSNVRISAVKTGVVELAKKDDLSDYTTIVEKNALSASISSVSSNLYELSGKTFTGSTLGTILVEGQNIEASTSAVTQMSDTTATTNYDTVTVNTMPNYPYSTYKFSFGQYVASVQAIYGNYAHTEFIDYNAQGVTIPTTYNGLNLTMVGYGEGVLSGIKSNVVELATKSDLPTYEYDSTNKISAINGSAFAGQGGVPQSAFNELKQSYDALSSLFATYSGQWLLPNEGV